MMLDSEGLVRPGEVIDGKYRVVQVLGQGGMGVVVQAEHVELGDQVAIKFLTPSLSERPETRARFLREAQTARQITSKHAVKVFDFGRLPSGSPYFVMEFLQGEDLAAVVERRGALPAGEAACHVRDACEAVAEAHRKGIVHRDLKPANLFLMRGTDGEITLKVLDFGIATVGDREEHAGGQLTSTGSIFGTPLYMSPEQVRGSHDVDPRSDVWSLGVVLYHLLTGSYPFEGDHPMAILARVFHESPVPLSARSPELPAALEGIVTRCLAKDPAARFPSAVELRSALEAFVVSPAGTASTSREDARGEPAPRPETLSLPPGSSPAAEPHITLSQELQTYLARARLRVSRVSGRVHFLEPGPGSTVRPARLAAVSFDDVIPSSERTLSTEAFQHNILEVLDFIGTDDPPWHVLAVFRTQPAAGVYRLWNALESRKVRILPISPHLIRAALDSDPATHLNRMMSSAPPDPFDLQGSVPNELGELEFFGGRTTLQNMLADLERHCPGLGAFGFSRWGVTSLLRRLRLELSGYVTAWVDVKALPDVSAATVLRAIHDKLVRSLGRSPKSRSSMTAPESEAAIQELIEAHAAGLDQVAKDPDARRSASADRRPLVLFLDHVDCLGASSHEDNPELLWMARCLYGLLAQEEPRPGLQIVFGGQDDSLLTKRFFRTGGVEVKNPLWKCGRSHPVPFFTVEELTDFFARLGGLSGLVLSRSAVEEAHRLTGGHKYLSRRLGSLLFQERRDRRSSGAKVEEADVRRCAGVLRAAESEYFEAVSEHLPKEALCFLQSLAERPSGQGIAGRSTAFVDAQAELLRSYSLVKRDPATQTYAPTIGVLSEWLLARATESSGPRDARPPPPGPAAAGPSTNTVPSQGTRAEEKPIGGGNSTAIRPHGTTFSTHYVVPASHGVALLDRRTPPPRADVFIACAPGDEAMGRELERFLRHPLEQAGITIWAEWHLKPGADASEIETAMASAKLFVVLLSGDFFDEAHCRDVVLPRLKKRIALQEAYLVPVVLKYCSWSSDPFFGRLAPLPKNREPVHEWHSRDAAWQDVVEGLLPIAKERCLPLPQPDLAAAPA